MLSLDAELPYVRGTFGIGLVDRVIRKAPELLGAVLAAVLVPVLALCVGAEKLFGSWG
jgi:hypothetical protein